MYTIQLAIDGTQTHKVLVDDDGVVTPPEGELLKDGTWYVYENKEHVGNLTVSGGEIGNVEFFPPQPLHGGGVIVKTVDPVDPFVHTTDDHTDHLNPFPGWPNLRIYN